MVFTIFFTIGARTEKYFFFEIKATYILLNMDEKEIPFEFPEYLLSMNLLTVLIIFELQVQQFFLNNYIIIFCIGSLR